MNAPMANLPVVIFQFAHEPVRGLEDAGVAAALLITLSVLVLNIRADDLPPDRRTLARSLHA
jgi:phosphate transport system permease protein